MGLGLGSCRFGPEFERFLGEVGGWPVVELHLLVEDFHVCLEEEGRVGAAGYLPDYVWGVAVVPSGGFGEDSGVFRVLGYVC